MSNMRAYATLFPLLYSIGEIYYGTKAYDTCMCPYGCNFTNQYVPKNNYNTENVALGKAAKMSSIYNNIYPACLAVNGNTGRSFANINSEKPNCANTEDERNPWWEVDLGRNYAVNSITIYTMSGFKERIQGVLITVDSENCIEFGVNQLIKEIEEIKCIQNLTGRVVKFSKNRNPRSLFMAFCEVQVWACIGGYYGHNCSQECGKCSNGSNTCDSFTGYCPADCESGWQEPLCNRNCDPGFFGEGCNYTCGHCRSNMCDSVSGNCTSGCSIGWKSPLCKYCDEGFHGDSCNYTCGHCSSSTCDSFSGNCTSGCSIGWKSPLCTESLESESSSSNVGVIVGIVIGVFVLTAVAAFIVIFVLRRQQFFAHKRSDVVKTESNMRNLNSASLKEHNIKSAFPQGQSKNETTEYSTIDKDIRPMYGNTSESEQVREVSEGGILQSITESKKRKPTKYESEQSKPDDAKPSKAARETLYVNVAVAPDGRKPLVPRKPPGIGQFVSREQVNPRDLPEESENMDEDNYTYDNEEIYSTCKSYRFSPVFDTLQCSLLTGLASGKLDIEFKEISKEMKYSDVEGTKKHNARKNRFKILCPYDHNRVILRRSKADTDTDYINASYIRGCEKDKKYIAAQGPRAQTVHDMWLMIWQEFVTHIVMLTNLKEDGKDKCEKYWPDVGITETHGNISVTCLRTEPRADYVIRSFMLEVKGNTLQRHVEQYHYVAWPDHGVPSAISLVNFWRYIHDRAPENVPLLVHCSAGVGRTGTYIALDIAMDMSAKGIDINVQKIVTDLREERHLMVQAEAQYKFLYEVILEAHTSRDTRLPFDQYFIKFEKAINIHKANTVIDKEFKMLQEVVKFVPSPKHTLAMEEENMSKNRNPKALPDDRCIAFVGAYIPGRNMYINAVFLSSFTHQRSLLLTQLPLPDTLVDIWRLIDDKDVNFIVSIGAKDEHRTDNNYCQYWPMEKGDEIDATPYIIKLNGVTVLNKSISSYLISFMKASKRRDVQLFNYTNWSGEVPESTDDVIQLVETLNSSLSQNDSGPTLVQCIDGAAKSGLFCILWENSIRATSDHEHDIYLTARKVLSVRPQAVTSEVQYRFCYKFAQDYQRHIGVYQNT